MFEKIKAWFVKIKPSLLVATGLFIGFIVLVLRGLAKLAALRSKQSLSGSGVNAGKVTASISGVSGTVDAIAGTAKDITSTSSTIASTSGAIEGTINGITEELRDIQESNR